MSLTLSLYIARQFLVWFATCFGALTSISMLFEMVELLRRASGKPDASITVVLQMMLLKAPFMSLKLVVFAVLFGAMATFWKLTRTQELVVARAAGVSAWQFLFPAIFSAALIGAVSVTMVNPLAASLLAQFERIENRVLKGRSSLLAVSSEGLWLRQVESEGQSVIRADSVAPGGMILNDVIVFRFDRDDRFKDRLDAKSAELRSGHWALVEVWRSSPGAPAQYASELALKTNLTVEKIQDSFASPESMSFWQLPSFVRLLELSGFQGHRHWLHFHRLLATPLLLAAMVLLAAVFSLRLQRRGGAMALIAAGVLSGFLIYFVSDLVFALGLSNSIPVVMAAWTPASVTAMLGMALVFHLEDG
ncbi:MAG: LPS export ABC transporter permease LptG [Alphaproteobacteria bacterium]|nr:LPS export ABC transporter permease LptG [Alphaproteobacteria bacterium]